jgi:hypothetical protein
MLVLMTVLYCDGIQVGFFQNIGYEMMPKKNEYF